MESLDESSEQRFLGGMGGIFRAPATAAEPPEKRKNAGQKCWFYVTVLSLNVT